MTKNKNNIKQAPKAQRQGYSLMQHRAKQSFYLESFVHTIGLTIFLSGLLIINASGQITQIQTPTVQNSQQFPQLHLQNQNNYQMPNFTSTTQHNNGTDQYEKDGINQLKRQQQLKEVAFEFTNPGNEMMNVNYDLPPCSSSTGTMAYKSAFSELLKIAEGEKVFNIKEANFIVEDAYYENTGKIENFDKTIQQIVLFLNCKMEEFGYERNSNLAKNLMLYRFFADTLVIQSKNLHHLPIKYDFNDYRGEKDWSKMFVEKLLRTNTGQCHSLPLLYLILAKEIGAEAQLAYSPNHTYIKFKDDNGNWHNVELTNGMLTTDAFILQSGYIKAEALQNKIYMQPLTDQQLLSHCLSGMAQGYIKKYCYDSFVEEVVDKSLELDPNNIHANMVKANYLTSRFGHIQNQLGINEQNYRQILGQYPVAKDIFIARNKQYAVLDNLGYEEMPGEAYEKWLNSLNEAKQMQESRQIFMNLDKSTELRSSDK